MLRIATVLLLTATLLTVNAPRAEASDSGGLLGAVVISAYALPVMTSSFALTTTIGNAASKRSKAWFVTGYIAGGLSLTAGIPLLALTEPDRDSPFFAMGVANVLVGISSIAMSIYNQTKPRPRADDFWGSTTIGAAVLQGPATGEQVPGLVMSGTF